MGTRMGVEEHGAFAASSEASVPCSPGMGTRVYMGGLGGGVTEADVEKAFAPLGRVSRVEFVRNKGRAFAFMDFEPNSDKSLAKLFATYNGCIWKGGRLKLEKAKEHYLNRLRREWAEDAEHTNKPMVVNVSKGLNSSDNSKSMTKEKMQLRVFFPKLRKVKVLPFKGTGKHKYSFQRIKTPCLPVHFCDCEEHYRSPEDNNNNRLNNPKEQTVVVNEQELIIMNSVMNKLFEKETNSNVAGGEALSGSKRNILDHFRNKTQFGDSEAAEQTDADADSLVTNIGLGVDEDVMNLMQLKGWDPASADQNSIRGKGQSFHDQVSEKQNTHKRRKTEPETVSEGPSSKRAHLPSEKSKKSKLSSTIAGKIECQETEYEERNDLPLTQSEGSNCPTEDPDIKPKTTENMGTGQSAGGTSWIQKSSWKELVGNAGNNTFTISHVLPRVDSSSERSSICNGTASIEFSAERTAKPVSESSYLKPVEVREKFGVEKIAAPRKEEKSSKEDGTHLLGEGSLYKDPRSSSSNLEPKPAAVKVGIGQVCTFMRSADSVKEWTKTKAALSGYLKKKKKQENRTCEGRKVPSHQEQ